MTQITQLATQVLIRGRPIKFTPERIQQIKNLVERGKSREEIAEVIGVTVGSLQVTCSRLGISLRRPTFNTGAGSLRRDEPRSNGVSTTTQRRSIEDDSDQDDYSHDGGMMGWGFGPDWRRQWGWRRGVMGPGMMGQGGTGLGGMDSGMMLRMLFSLMDGDGDGTISLQEFQAAHERIFRAMDANKDGHLSLEEIQAFMQGTRRSGSRQ
jgi:hypothetical protein